MEKSEYRSCSSDKRKGKLDNNHFKYSDEFLDFLQVIFNLTEKFKNLKSLIIASKMKMSYYQNCDKENYYNDTGIKKEKDIFNFRNFLKNLNLSEKIPYYNTLTNITDSQYFGYFIIFFNSITIYGRSPIKSRNFYHYITEAWILTVFSHLKNAIKAEGKIPNFKPIRNFKDLFYFIKNLKINEQLFSKNLEIILGTYDLSDNIIKVSEFKLSQQFLKKLKLIFENENEMKSSFRNLKLYILSNEIRKHNSYFYDCNSSTIFEKAEQNNANIQQNKMKLSNPDDNDEDFFNHVNFDLNKSGFLYLMKDILDKVLNYTLNELDGREKYKESSRLYDTYREIIFSNALKNKENLKYFLTNQILDNEASNNATAYDDLSKLLNLKNIPFDFYEEENDYYYYDSENKIPFENFCKELKKTEKDNKLNSLSDFSTFHNNSIYTINNMSSIAHDLSEGLIEENSMNSFSYEAELLNPNQTFYDYGITTMNDFLQDIELITLKSASFWEKLSAMLKNNFINIKRNMISLINSNPICKSTKNIIKKTFINIQEVNCLLRTKGQDIKSFSFQKSKLKYEDLKFWIKGSINNQYSNLKNFSENVFSRFNTYRKNAFMRFKQPISYLENIYSDFSKFIDDNIFIRAKNMIIQAKEIFIILIDYQKLYVLISHENWKFITDIFLSSLNYVVDCYNDFTFVKMFNQKNFDFMIKIINIPKAVAKNHFILFVNFASYVYERICNCFNINDFRLNESKFKDFNVNIACEKKNNEDECYEYHIFSVCANFKNIFRNYLLKYGLFQLIQMTYCYFREALDQNNYWDNYSDYDRTLDENVQNNIYMEKDLD